MGQLERSLGVTGYGEFSTELFWPWAEHTYPLELHRRRLIEEAKRWARSCFFRPVIESQPVNVIPAEPEEMKYAS